MTELHGTRVIEDTLLPHHVAYEVTPYNLTSFVALLVDSAIDDFCADEDSAILLDDVWSKASAKDKIEFSAEVLKEIIKLYEIILDDESEE